jgi:hypothetical protein
MRSFELRWLINPVLLTISALDYTVALFCFADHAAAKSTAKSKLLSLSSISYIESSLLFGINRETLNEYPPRNQ